MFPSGFLDSSLRLLTDLFENKVDDFCIEAATDDLDCGMLVRDEGLDRYEVILFDEGFDVREDVVLIDDFEDIFDERDEVFLYADESFDLTAPLTSFYLDQIIYQGSIHSHWFKIWILDHEFHSTYFSHSK